jgi:hypothetical protein
MVSSKTIIFSRFTHSSLLLVCVLFFTQISPARSVNNSQTLRASTISGIVYDQNRRPVQQVDVELENAAIGGSTSLRTKTDAIGRYEFNNIPDGRYRVKVLPFRFNLQDQSAEVIVQTVSLLGGGSGYFNQDFYLKYKTGGLGDTTTGVIFAQEIPKEAQSLYEEAEEEFKDKRPVEGMKKLISAIRVFPNYYVATQRLGMEFLFTEQYLDAVNMFVRAAEINPKSSRSFYWMGFALNKLGKKYNQASLLALSKASVLAPASWEVALLTGKVHRQEGNFQDAETHLLKSKKLIDSKNPEIHKELAQLYANDLKEYAKAADELELYLKSSKKKDEKIEATILDLRKKAKNSK